MTESKDAAKMDRRAQALAAALGAFAGLPLGGPVGSVVGAAVAPFLVPVAEQILNEVGLDGRRRSGAVLAAACESSDLPAEVTLSRIFADEKSRLLAATVVAAATRTAWEGKVRTLGRSLAAGLLASDEAEVDTEQLIISAIADIEGPQLALLDFLVTWENVGLQNPGLPDGVSAMRVDIPAYSRANGVWNVGSRIWPISDLVTLRPRLARVLFGLLGTLQRHGLVVLQARSTNTISNLSSFSIISADSGIEQQSGSAPSIEGQAAGPNSALSAPPPALLQQDMECQPTELGEEIWLRFREAGANAPDVWHASSAQK
jgi:hypothetical protein